MSDPEIGSGSATSGFARRGDGVRGTVDVKPRIGRQVEDFTSIWQGTALRLQLDVHSRKALPARTGLRCLLRSKDVLDAEVLCRPERVTTEARERSGCSSLDIEGTTQIAG